MVLLQSSRQEVPKWSEAEQSGGFRLLESHGHGQAHSHDHGGDPQDWGEEGARVLQRPGSQRCEDQLDHA
jgi:hypothetical protein